MIADNPQDVIVSKLELKRLRAELVRDEEGKEDFFSFQARCVKKFGAFAGIYIRQLVFWADKGMDPDGWIYKSEGEWEDETGLSRDGQRKARKALEKFGVLESRRRGLPCRLWYRADLEKLAELLENPYSTWNQWKRGTKKDPETGKFYRPEEPTLNHSSSQDPIGTEQAGSTWGPNKEGSYTNPTSEVAIATEQGRSLYQPDKSGPYSDLAITETTSRENIRRVTPQNSLENSSREFPFQGAAGAQNRAAPPHQINKSSQSTEEEDSTTSFPHQRDVDPKMAKEVRQLMENGRHAPVALKHYRAGRLSVEDVAEYVSQDAAGSDKLAKTLLSAVRLVLEESVGVAS